MVKLSDVAAEAGLSTATVSRALNGHPTVNPEMAARARAVADRLGYRPNRVARSLRRQSSEVIALIISDVGDPFFTAVTRGAEDVAQAAGYSVLLCNADEDPQKEARYLAIAEQQQVAGVILSPHGASSDVSRLLASGIPLVVIDRPIGHRVDTVTVESVAGARRAVEHLVRSGRQRIACITGPDDAATANERLQGYLQAVPHEPIYMRTQFSSAGGVRAARSLLNSSQPPDAFFTANAQIALGLMTELRERGLIAGQDVGLITFDDAPWTAIVTPPMSVVAQPAYEIGTTSAELLVARIAGSVDGSPKSVVLPTRLVIRESSGPASVDATGGSLCGRAVDR
jgi:LacI family transcriptional regulator